MKLSARIDATFFSGVVLALVFGILWTAISSFDNWKKNWLPRLGKDAVFSIRLPSEHLQAYQIYHGKKTQARCEPVIPRGQRLKYNSPCSKVVKDYVVLKRDNFPFKLLGTFILYFSILLAMTSVMRAPTMGRARFLRPQIVLMSIITLILAASKAILILTVFTSFSLPIIAIPLLIAYFFRRNLAFVFALSSAFIACSFINYDIEIFLVYLLSGTVSIMFIGKRRRAFHQIKAGAMGSWVALCTVALTTLIFTGVSGIPNDISTHLDPRYSLWISSLAGAILSGITAWLLTPITGWLIGEVSRGKLLDLQDLDQRILNILRERAPGTWEHSRFMANLAEAAVHSIGGQSLLVRIGSYYHDVGKSVKPDCFVENQLDHKNPHDTMTPEASKKIIFSHVKEGVKLLRKEGVPEDIIEFCYSHHGTSVLEYFWHKNLENGNLKKLKEKDFKYPGHKPTTRETGILMLVDAIEAASRTVDNPGKDAFSALVRQIVFSKLVQRQLDETGLTLSDLQVVSNTLIDTLVNMYHSRVKYPWQTDTDSVSTQDLEKSESDKSDNSKEIATVSGKNSNEEKMPEKEPDKNNEESKKIESAKVDPNNKKVSQDVSPERKKRDTPPQPMIIDEVNHDKKTSESVQISSADKPGSINKTLQPPLADKVPPEGKVD